jgi:predicted nucleotidyltransferase
MAHCSKTPAPTGESEPQILPDMTVQMIADRFARDDRVLAVYLFGSGARGAMRPDSDIDIGVLPAPGVQISSLELADIAAGLAFETGRPVDAGIVDSRDLVYAKEALDGRPIYVRPGNEAGLRAAVLLALYLRFSEDRKEVVDAYGG